jgi:hypothetical protein
MCSMMLHIESTYNEVWYFTHDVRPCYDFNMKSSNQMPFACSRKICVILFNAHYPISLRSKEQELIRMFEIILGSEKWTCLKQKEQSVRITYFFNIKPILFFFIFIGGGGGVGSPPPGSAPSVTHAFHTSAIMQNLYIFVNTFFKYDRNV